MRQAVRMLPNHVGLKINLALLTDFAGDFETSEQQLKAIPQMDARALLARFSLRG